MTDSLFTPDQGKTNDYWDILTKEGGKFDKTKYQTDDDLKKAVARGKYEADQTVEQMKSRLDELREDYQKLHETREAGATLKELLDQVKVQKQSDGDFTPKANDVNVQPKTEDLEKTVEALIAKRDAAKSAEHNLSIVQQKLKERYGDNYSNILSEQRDALKLTDADVNDLARKSPEAFLRVMGLTDTKQEDTFQAPPRSARRSDNFSPNSNPRTWSYYQNLKKQDKALYYSPKIFNQMLKDAEDLGEKFKDGDFSRFGD